jgi:hypothetical protein
MSVALHPDLPQSLLSHLIVDDVAPSKGGLSADFKRYVEGMIRIESARVRSRKEAQDILIEYEKVCAVYECDTPHALMVDRTQLFELSYSQISTQKANL